MKISSVDAFPQVDKYNGNQTILYRWLLKYHVVLLEMWLSRIKLAISRVSTTYILIVQHVTPIIVTG